MQAQNAAVDALLKQRLACQKSRGHGFSDGNQRDIIILTLWGKSNGFTNLEMSIRGVQVRHGFLPEADVNWARIANRGLDDLNRFKVIRWGDNIDIIDGLQGGKIMQGMMSGTQCTITHARADPNDLNRLVGVGDIIFNLLQERALSGNKQGNCKNLFTG